MQTFSDVLPPHTGERTGLLFQIQDDNWGGLFVDIEKTQFIPDRSVIKMILDLGAKGDKQQLVNALAPCFIQSGEVVIKEGADISNLSCNDVVKEGTF